MTIGLIGHTVIDTVVGPDGGASRRLGGTPLYARRALEAAGADCIVVTRGADPGKALVVPGGPAYDSRLDHRDGTKQVLARFGLPFSPTETVALVLPAVRGCHWLHLGPQWRRVPARDAGPSARRGAQSVPRRPGARPGIRPGAGRLRPFPPRDIAGVAILKLNRAEAEAVAGAASTVRRSWAWGRRRSW